jgi:hypothetical protein
MNQNTHHWIWAIALILALVLGITYGEYQRSVGARDATIAASKKEVDMLHAEMAQREEIFKQRFDDLEKQKQQVKTAPQAVRIIHDTIPLATPIALTPESTPDAPSAVLGKDQLIELSKFGLSCKQCELERDKGKDDLKGKDKEIGELKVQRDAALKQAKGGSWLQRQTRNSKWYGAGIATGIILVKIFLK